MVHTSSLKLQRKVYNLLQGQYTKLPPRATFIVQSLGAVIGGLLNYLIMKIVIDARRDILLDVQGSNVWSGQQVQSFNSDAVTWGALAEDLFSPGSRYAVRPSDSTQSFSFLSVKSQIVPMAVLIGLAVPVPFFIVHRYFPKLGANKVVTPVICC